MKQKFSVSLTLALILAMLVTSLALADDISNNLDADIDATLENISLIVGGGNGTVGLYVKPRNGDDNNGCNFQGTTETLVVSVNSSNTSVATVSPASITFGSCGDTPSITVTPVGAGSANISLNQVSNNTGGTFNLAPASFTVDVTASADTTPPTISCDIPDKSLWYGNNVTVNCTASDPSGLADQANASFSLVTSVAAGDETNSALTDSREICDIYENCDTAGPYTFMVDKKAPTITITAPVGSYLLNQVVASDFHCSDGGSGVADCDGVASIDTASVGLHTFTVGTTDNVGNSSSASVRYDVNYALCVLYDQSKSHKSGSTVPLKLQLCDVNGVNYSSASIVMLATGKIKSDDSASGVTEDSGNANPDCNFRYDATLGGTGGYIYNLSTKGLTSGTWKVTFSVDGVSASSYFVTFDIK